MLWFGSCRFCVLLIVVAGICWECGVAAIIRIHQNLSSWLPSLLTIIAPRHPARGHSIRTVSACMSRVFCAFLITSGSGTMLLPEIVTDLKYGPQAVGSTADGGLQLIMLKLRTSLTITADCHLVHGCRSHKYGGCVIHGSQPGYVQGQLFNDYIVGS